MELNEDFSAIMAGLDYHKNCHQWVSDYGKFIPDPANWLKKQGWLNRPPLYTEKTQKPATIQQPTGATGHLGPEEVAAIRRSLAEAESMGLL